MTLLFVDGFDVGDHALKWTYLPNYGSASSVTISSFGLAGARSLSMPSATATAAQLTRAFTASSQVTIGFWYRIDVSSGSNSAYEQIYLYGDNGTTLHVTLAINPSSGNLTVYRGAVGGAQLGTAPGAVAIGTSSASQWQFIEMTTTVNGTTGICQLRVNGNQVVNFTGNTKNGGTNSTLDTVRIIGLPNGPGATVYWDDFYCLNSLGTTNNGFLGPIRVQTLKPNAAGTDTQLTPSAGASNYPNVNTQPYSTAAYNSSPVSGTRDTYNLDDLTAGTSTVYGLQDNVIAHASDAGAVAVKPVLRTSGGLYYDPTFGLSASAKVFSTVRETSPATAAAWTPADVNALEAGAEVA